MLAGRRCPKSVLQRCSLATGTVLESDARRRILSYAVQELERCGGSVAGAEKYAELLRRCLELRDATLGRRIHKQIAASRFNGHRSLSNLLLRLYGRCGCVEEARLAFESFRQPRDVFSWNGLLEAYARNGHMPECLQVFLESPLRNEITWNLVIQGLTRGNSVNRARELLEKMPLWGAVSLTLMLAAYAEHGIMEEAREMFEKLPVKDSVACNTMIRSYIRAGNLEEARGVFQNMSERTQVSWTMMIAAYAREGYLTEARQAFDALEKPDKVAWTTIIQAYSKAGRIEEANSLFERMVDPDAVTCTVMVSLYSQFGLEDEARALFERSPEQNSISWNSMIMAYGRSGRIDEAKRMFDDMPMELRGMASSWNVMISAYSQSSMFQEAKKVFDLMPIRDEASNKALLLGYINKGLVIEARDLFDRFKEKSDVVIWNTMLGAYSQCGDVENSKKLFQQMPDPSPVSWDMLVSAHANAGDAKQAFVVFRLIDLEGARPSSTTVATILDACSSSSFSSSSSTTSSLKLGLGVGRILHQSLRDCCWDSGISVRNSLLSMYGKCGSVEDAKKVFDETKSNQLNIVSWNLLLSAYALNGRNVEVLELFRAMNLEGFAANQVTLLIYMNACSHAGFLRDGLTCFTSIVRDFGVDLHSEHYKCVVDLLGRSGELQEAEEFMQAMPPAEVDDGVRTSLLSACSAQQLQTSVPLRKFSNPSQENSSLYVLLSHANILRAVNTV